MKSARGLLLLMVSVGASVPAAYAGQQTLSFPMQGYEGNFREHCMELAAGRTLTWTLYSPFAVQMNIHHHVGNRTQFLFDGLAENTSSDSVDLSAAGEYCFEIANSENRRDGFEVKLKIEVSSSG